MASGDSSGVRPFSLHREIVFTMEKYITLRVYHELMARILCEKKTEWRRLSHRAVTTMVQMLFVNICWI